MDSKNVRKVEIFISSPSDVVVERTIIKRVVERLRRKQRLSDRFTFEALAYEDWVPPTIGEPPQPSVNNYMRLPRDCEVFICVMWHRMGTPLVMNGESFDSGTHYEFMDAYRANQENPKKGRPIILLYRGQKAYPLTVDGDQLNKVNNFFKQFHGTDAKYLGIYKVYSSDDEFERNLLDDLEQVIATHFEPEPIELNALPWNEIIQNISVFTQHMLGFRYKAKYSPDYYSPRYDILEHLRSFLTSEKILMVITGKAGTGKSSLVSDIATNPSSNTVVWLQDCAVLKLDDDASLDDYIHEKFKLPTNVTLLKALNDFSLKQPGKTLLLLFDAVNEYEKPSLLLKKLSDLIIRINAPNVKVLLTCRVPAWNMLKRFLEVPIIREFHVAGPNSYVSFADIFNDNEMEQIYQKYQEAYSLKTNFANLSSIVKEFITQPLFLKLMAVAYRGKEIPDTLSVEEVLKRYIDHCLKIDSDDESERKYESLPEFLVLKTAIQLMYEKARRELELMYLREDDKVGKYISLDLSSRTPYADLVNEGILSQRIDEDFAQRIELVFVTYERVFEYLLAMFNISPVNIVTIQNALEVSKKRSFLQLRGAAELALGFAIIKNLLSKDEIIGLAKNDLPEVRQFLSDVIQTIYSTGHRKLVEDIITDLINVKVSPTTTEIQANAANQLAVMASYQLRLDEELVRFAMSKKPLIRELASLYLYQRWNKARLEGRLSDGYGPIESIAKKVKILPVPSLGTVQALSALATVSINMMAHIIDDIDSLQPLLKIWQNIVRQIPGIEPRPSRSLMDTLTKRITDTLIDVVSQVLTGVIEKSILGNTKLLEEFWSDPRSQRAFLDASILFNEQSLLAHEARVRTLLTWKHDLVPYVLMNPLMHHIYARPDEHIPMLQRIFYDVDTYVFRSRFQITLSLTYGGLCRVLRGLSLTEELTYQVESNLFELWQMVVDSENDSSSNILEAVSPKEAMQGLQLIFVGIMHLEALQQSSEGKFRGSEFFMRFIEALDFELTEEQLKTLVKTIEHVAYLGFPDLAVATILNNDFRRLWLRVNSNIAIRSLANIRSFYQDEVDSLITQNYDRDATILKEIRLIGTIPDTNEVLFANSNLWLISTAVEPAVTKMAGNFMGDLVFFSHSVKDFVRSFSRTLITALFDFDAINITHIQWGFLHNPEWDNFEQWEIPRELVNAKPEIHEYWKSIIEPFTIEHGRGILYDEL